MKVLIALDRSTPFLISIHVSDAYLTSLNVTPYEHQPHTCLKSCLVGSKMCFSFRLHPRDEQDVASRLTLGARVCSSKDPSPLKSTSCQHTSTSPLARCCLSHHLLMPFRWGSSPTWTRNHHSRPSVRIFTWTSFDELRQPSLSSKICCSETQAPCGPGSPWVAAPGYPDGVQLSVSSLCLSAEDGAALRCAWKDCPIWPAPPFITHRHDNLETPSGARLIQTTAVSPIYFQNRHHCCILQMQKYMRIFHFSLNNRVN